MDSACRAAGKVKVENKKPELAPSLPHKGQAPSAPKSKTKAKAKAKPAMAVKAGQGKVPVTQTPSKPATQAAKSGRSKFSKEGPSPPQPRCQPQKTLTEDLGGLSLAAIAAQAGRKAAEASPLKKANTLSKTAGVGLGKAGNEATTARPKAPISKGLAARKKESRPEQVVEISRLADSSERPLETGSPATVREIPN